MRGDNRDAALVADAARLSVVFHLAAQPLVRESYRDPIGTFASNVMGTAHVLDAARRVEGVAAVVVVTTDKVYENEEWPHPYRERDGSAATIPTARARPPARSRRRACAPPSSANASIRRGSRRRAPAT